MTVRMTMTMTMPMTTLLLLLFFKLSCLALLVRASHVVAPIQSSGSDNVNKKFGLDQLYQSLQQQQQQHSHFDRHLQTNPSSCSEALLAADDNGDGRVDADDYIAFVGWFRPSLNDNDNNGNDNDIRSFVDLPLRLQSNFFTLACVCNDSDDCCLGDNAHLPVPSTSTTTTGSTTDSIITERIDQICFLTEAAVASLPSPAPTPMPTSLPTLTPTISPTVTPPTISPTLTPTTTSPTQTPTLTPTLTPTIAPTIAPTSTTTTTTTTTTTAAPTTTTTTTTTTPTTTDATFVMISYTIVVSNGQLLQNENQTEYSNELVQAMNRMVLSTGTSDSSSNNNNDNDEDDNNRRRHHRHLRQRLANDGMDTTTSNLIDVAASSSTTSILRGNIDHRQVIVPIEETSSRILSFDPKTFTQRPLTTSNGIYQGAGPCPADLGNPNTDLCLDVSHVVPWIPTLLLPSSSSSSSSSSPNNGQEQNDSVLNINIDNMESPKDQYEFQLQMRIWEGELQVFLQQVAPNSVVSVISGQKTNLITNVPTEGKDEDGDNNNTLNRGSVGDDGEELPGAAKFGIVAASFGLVGFIGFFVYQRQRQTDTDGSNSGKGTGYAVMESIASGDDPEDDLKALATTTGDTENMASPESSAFVPPNTPQRTSSSTAAVIPPIQFYPNSPQKSLPESESGWSSSQGHSSQGTADQDAIREDQENDFHPKDDNQGQNHYIDRSSHSNSNSNSNNSTGSLNSKSEGNMDALFSTQMVDLQEMASHEEEEERENQHNATPVDDDQTTVDMSVTSQQAISNLHNLEHAIMIGDWAAVGVSAAYLASTADSVTLDTQSQTDMTQDISTDTSFASALANWKSNKSNSWKMAHDTQRAAQLDELIEQGDWEAVIVAAAKFDAEDDDDDDDDDGANDDYSSQASQSLTNTTKDNDDDDDDDTDKIQIFRDDSSSISFKNDEQGVGTGNDSTKRDQIAKLMSQVVPEEADDLDDMMREFAGREDDLIETLQAMKQRHGTSQGTSGTDRK